MQNQNQLKLEHEHKLSSFWFGFLLGGVAAGSAAFFLGTKRGRKTLKHLLEMTEDMEQSLETLFDEYGDEIREKGSEFFDELKKLPKGDSHTPIVGSTLHGLLDKMKTLSPGTKKKEKQFFVKE